jgi:hypothetical protein
LITYYFKILAMLFNILWICAAAGAAAEPPKQRPLRDGAILAGVDGTLSKSPDTNMWVFTLKTAVSDDKGAIEQGQPVEILKSSTLEKMISVLNDSKADFRLWGHVTQFEDKNSIFPVYFLSVAEARQRDANAPSAQKPISINEPNDVIKIPQEILEKLKPQRTVELTQLSPTAGLEEDRMFSDRSGFIIKEAEGSYIFKPDALGRNLQKISFAVLPNDVLQQAMDEQAHEPDRVRFRITGILTTCSGQNYILLQRAVRQYSHGNFAR